MENPESKQKSSRLISLLFLIPAMLLGLISLALAIVGFGLIPILPAVIGIILCIISVFLFKRSYKIFTRIVITLSIVAAIASFFRGAVFEKRVANDQVFDSTVVKTQEGIDSDLLDAFGDDVFGTEEKKDTIPTN
jgi:Mn2+/Fe2+ NRAMP family transporter